MARLTDKERASIMAEYHIGVSQNKLAIKYDVSPATINKLCKGVAPKHVNNVNELTRIKIELAAESELQVNVIDAEVNNRARDMKLFRDASILVLNKALNKLDSEDVSMADIERAQNVIGKGKENIYGKQPDTAVQINNQTKTYGWEE